MNLKKVFVKVIVKFETDGRIIPLSVILESGREFPIDKVTDIRQAASLKCGGQGIRYTCRIRNKETYLFYEGPNWFVEMRTN